MTATDFLAVDMFRDARLNMVPIATDQNGMRMDSLETEIQLVAAAQRSERVAAAATKSTGGPKPPKSRYGGEYDGLIFLVPTFGNPTGATMPDDRRRRLVHLARRHNLLVLSDDVYQLLNFPGVPMPKRLVAYDLEAGAGCIDGIECGGKCHVVSNCSFSKLIGPGTRLGWIEAGVTLIDSILASGVLESSGSMNHLSSGIMAHLLGSGAQAAILAELRTTYAARANALCTALKESLPAAAQLLVQPTGGFFAWLLLPEKR